MTIKGHYAAHGVVIKSDLALPEFLLSGEVSSNPISITHCDTLPLPDSPEEYGRGDEVGFRVAWTRVGAFQIAPSGRIFYRRAPGASDQLIRVPLLGSILAIALHFRGTLVMHGNAMSVNGKGIIVVGAKGQGKSTLSAALAGRGHRLQAEDASSVDLPPNLPAATLRGTRQLRLWHDSLEQSFGKAVPLARPIHELSDKCVVSLMDQPDIPERLPLARIYVLEDADEISLCPLPPAEAWQLILTHSLVSRFGSELLAGPGAARHFASCMALAKKVSCVRLRRPRSFSRLGDVVSSIEQDLISA